MSDVEIENDNTWSIFWRGLLVCFVLAFIVYLIG